MPPLVGSASLGPPNSPTPITGDTSFLKRQASEVRCVSMQARALPACITLFGEMHVRTLP